MNNAPKTATLLIDLLSEQHKERSPHLFRKGTFTLSWRAKVGSFPFPNLETIVSAAEPCGRFDWLSQSNASRFAYHQPLQNEENEARPEFFGNLSDLTRNHRQLKLNGYIPGSAIRGIVRAWAMQRCGLKAEALRLLGKQDSDSDKITPGKIVFLDAWPAEAQRLDLDIVNPQQDFQVYHKPQGSTPQACNPQAIYTLGDGTQRLKFTVAIRGIPDVTRPDQDIAEDVKTVWQWLKQALSLNGVGGRTASGYGTVIAPRSPNTKPSLPAPYPGQVRKLLDFSLYSQGCYGLDKDDRNHPKLRPSHWRGWLRSWTLRFLLGIFPDEQAKLALANLLGAIEPKAQKGCVRIRMHRGKVWGDRSDNSPYFYVWKGRLEIVGPEIVVEQVILPIIRVASSLGGVGHGWRRPLHIFYMPNHKPAARGCHLILQSTGQRNSPLLLPIDTNWQELYETWKTNTLSYFQDEASLIGEQLTFMNIPNRELNAEIFSPNHCSIYLLPGPFVNPVDEPTVRWVFCGGQLNYETAEDTRGDGVWLIYQKRYKRNTDVGGRAGDGSAFCSWVSIRRIDVPCPSAETACQEMVCLFLGRQGTDGYNADRYQFLRDLGWIEDSTHLFGVSAPS